MDKISIVYINKRCTNSSNRLTTLLQFYKKVKRLLAYGLFLLHSVSMGSKIDKHYVSNAHLKVLCKALSYNLLLF